MSNFKLNCKQKSFQNEDHLFWFVVIDILFLPYFTFMSVSYSVPFVLIWMVLHYRHFLRGRENKWFIVLVFCMLTATVISLFYTQPLRFETAFSTTTKRLIQYMVCFGYYYFFKYYFNFKRINLEKVLFWFIVVVFIFSVLFLLFPQQYGEIKLVMHPADNHTRRYLEGSVNYRFNYLWTDPNNIAYLVDGILFWIWLNGDLSMVKKIVVTIFSGLIMLATASNGGLIIYVLVIGVLLLKYFLFLIKNAKVKISNIIIWSCFFILILIVFSSSDIVEYIQRELWDKLGNRWMYYLNSNDISGGRFTDLGETFKYLDPLLFFLGVGKEGFSSENGHIYWIGMYGMPAYISFMYIVFAKFKNVSWQKYIWIIPFFVAFTMNIAIGEFKWFAIYLMILAYSRYSVNMDVEERILTNE